MKSAILLVSLFILSSCACDNTSQKQGEATRAPTMQQNMPAQPNCDGSCCPHKCTRARSNCSSSCN